MSDVTSLLAQLRGVCARPGEVVDSDPGPARTRGTTTEAGRQRIAEDSGTVGRLPAPLPLRRGAHLDGSAHGQPGTGYPAVVWQSPAVPTWVESVIRHHGMGALLAEEGDETVCGPCRREPLPLWRLRRPDGKPNYASAAEMERYLKESGWLAWSSRGGGTKGSHTPPEDAWEVWALEQGDPRRLPPADADSDLLHDLQLEARRPSPLERLAEATVDTDEPEQLGAFDTDEGGDLIAA